MANVVQVLTQTSLPTNDSASIAPEIQRLWCDNLHEETEATIRKIATETNSSYCAANHDGALCWPPTLAGMTAHLPCPQTFDGEVYNTGVCSNNSSLNVSSYFDAAENSSRYCLESGIWSSRTNYSQCLVEDTHTEVDLTVVLRIIFISGYSISFGSLCIALLIFRYFKSLKCVRNTIHANLFAALLVRVIAWIMMYSYSELVTFSKTSRFNVVLVISILNATACIQSFGSLAIFFWMFVEGFYLFLVVHYTYRAEKVTFRYYALIGWGFPGVLTLIRIIVDAVNHPLKLWVLEGCDRYLVTIPALFMLGLNVLFLIAILYALNGKLRRRFSLGGHMPAPPPNFHGAPSGNLSVEARPHNCTARVSCPLMFALPSSETPEGPNLDLNTTDNSSSNDHATGSDIPSPQFSVHRGLVMTDRSDVHQSRQTRSLSNGSSTPKRNQTQQENCSCSVRQSRGNPFGHLGSSSRADLSASTRLRLWKLIGRINNREFVKTVKAGLMLMPLLGLPEIIFITPYHPSLKPAFDLIAAFLKSTQGFWVSLLYCFLTQEVRTQLAKRKQLLSIRSSMRPHQRWPPLLRQHKSGSRISGST